MSDEPRFPMLEIAAIVDATTVALVGPGVDTLREGDELYILAVGKAIVPKANLPLVAPKAKVEVTFPAGPYALARTPVQEKQVAMFPGFQSMFDQIKVVERRPPLSIDDNEKIGNPGRYPVRVGDIVVKTGDVGEYILWRARQTPAETKSSTS